jgi:hypothetical protein
MGDRMFGSRWGLTLLFALAGCAGSPYTPGAFTDFGRAPDARVRALDCVDVRVKPRSPGDVLPRWVVIDYEIGNRCRGAARVDFEAVAVFGQSGTFMEPLPLYDPRDEVHVATLDGRRWAREALAYETPREDIAALDRVCIDVSGLADGERVDPICFRRDKTDLVLEATR